MAQSTSVKELLSMHTGEHAPTQPLSGKLTVETFVVRGGQGRFVRMEESAATKPAANA